MGTGCSVQSKLNREYVGRSEELLIKNMGKPTSVVQLPNNKKQDIFEKSTKLRSTPINTGQFQYDRLESPETTKAESFKFTINAGGIIEKVQYEYQYYK